MEGAKMQKLGNNGAKLYLTAKEVDDKIGN